MSKQWRSGPPSSHPTKSFWQDPPDAQLANYTSETFPEEVDIVIIGSGLTGALIAHNLLSRRGPKPSVLLVEARTAASGATGRNGGHIKPDCCRGFAGYRELHGEEVAVQQCHFEAANLAALVAFIEEHGLVEEVDLVTCETADVYMNEGAWVKQLESFEAFKAAGGNVSRVRRHAGEAAKEFTRAPGCYGAFSYPAASLWPYKLTIAVLRMALALGLNLQTNTAVTDILATEKEEWKVVTTAGSVKARRIFHATNGYCSNLLPELTGIVIPLLGHVAAIPPTPLFSQHPLQNTAAFVWDRDYDYIIQRQSKGQHLIIGGRDLSYPSNNAAPLGVSDDSASHSAVHDALKAFPGANFKDWGAGTENGNGNARCWTGIMGYSKDTLPFLGELPGKKGQYIAAGYHGHGMARIFLSVKGLCEFACGEEVDKRVPAVYFDLERRFRREIDLG